MKKVLTCLFAIAFSATAFAQSKNSYTTDNPAYVIYNAKGQMVSYAQMVTDVLNADVCLFGELHNDPISHWMELCLLKSFYEAKRDSLAVGAEMWETDNQLVMDEFMTQNLIDEKTFAESSRLWNNYKTDYKPILMYAKEKGLTFVCTNVPRRYARIVFQKGIEYLDSLSPEAKAFLPPLPIHIDLAKPAYAKMVAGMPSREGGEGMAARMPMKAGQNIAKAQALKDATMAHSILKYWKAGRYFYHFHGEYHSANHESIEYYLKHYNPSIRVKTISIIKQDSVMNFDAKDSHANYNIVVPSNMCNTY